MLYLTPRDRDVYHRIMETAPRQGLPVLTASEAYEDALDAI